MSLLLDLRLLQEVADLDTDWLSNPVSGRMQGLNDLTSYANAAPCR